MFAKKTLVTTSTGEPYQPARIYYQVFNRKTVIGALNKIRCISYDRASDLWEWGYEFEAQKLRFEKSYHNIPKERRPILIGRFHFKSDDSLVLDVRSLDRITKALAFFDKRINRRAAIATHVAFVNKLFAAEELPNRELYPDHDIFFESEEIKLNIQQQTEELTEMQVKLDAIEDEEEKMSFLSEFMEQVAHKELPKVEELPVHYEDEQDGFLQLRMTLAFRQRVAEEHWEGNKKYKLIDAIESFVDFTSEDEL
jgi:hypothetical protein